MKRWILFVAAAIATGLAYPLARQGFLDQSTSYTSTSSNITLNYVLALYCYGASMDRVAKRIGQRKGWVVFGVGLIIILAALKYVFGWTARW